jgi:large conductance mechanosensitive channel
MGMIKEFKEFAMKGNMIDLAVGVVIGGAFGKIVTSLVNDIIMPPLNLVTAKSGVNFKELALKSKFELPVLTKEGIPEKLADGTVKTEMKEVAISNYGMFMQNIVDFLIIAIAIFFVVKMINSMKKKEEAAPPPAPPEDVLLLREIRDALAKNAPRRVE